MGRCSCAHFYLHAYNWKCTQRNNFHRKPLLLFIWRLRHTPDRPVSLPPPPSFLSTWLYCNRIWWMKGISACLFPIWSSFRCWCSQLIFHTKKKTKNKKKINKSAVFSSVSPRGLHLPPIRKCALQLPVWSKPITGGQSVVCGTCVLFYSPPRPKMSCNSIMCDPLLKC